MRYSRDQFPPGFFDLPQHAGATLPVEVIAEWNRAEQTAMRARTILAPHRLEGIVAASDSAGLTRLSRERPLIEILSMISHPKEIIHAYGMAIGGRAIGIWAADNSQMFYPSSVDASVVVSMLHTVMKRISDECELAIGMAAHAGVVYELSGSLYGAVAERVELIAEEYSRGGELLITEDLVALLDDRAAFTVDAAGLPERTGVVLSVSSGPMLEGIDARDIAYPAPYASDFTARLGEYTRTGRPSRMPSQSYRTLAVVFVHREAEELDVPEVAVLNDLAMTAAMQRIGRSLATVHAGEEIKNSGLVSIYAFEEPRRAVQFARNLRDTLAAQQVRTSIGIDVGAVLVFDLGRGTRDIAGSPVNIAAKLAQEAGAFGKVQVSDDVARAADLPRKRPTRTFTVSGVALRAHDV